MDNYPEQKLKLTQRRDYLREKVRLLEERVQKEQEEMSVPNDVISQVSTLEEVW
jgi:hypothetical protein